MLVLFTALCLGPVQTQPGTREAWRSPPATVRMVDVDGDGRLDRLRMDGDGTLSIALNRGARRFLPVVQELPLVIVSDLLVADLNADGHPDLYLVSPGTNVALLGDGTGRFEDATVELGLGDAGAGLAAESLDIDGDGIVDVLVHNADGDTVLWGTPGGRHEPERWTESSPFEPGLQGPSIGATPTTIASGPGGPVSPAPALGTTGVGQTGTASLDPQVETLGAFPTCARTLRDLTTGSCLHADSTPTLGRLYPLGPELNIDLLGRVGIGTLTPQETLDVAGTARVSGFRMPNAAGAGLVLTSDHLGTGTWQTPDTPGTRTLGLPAAALNVGAGVTPSHLGYEFQPGYSSSVSAVIPMPGDWDGTSDFVVSVLFTPATASAGVVSFFVRVAGCSLGETMNDPGSTTSPGVIVSSAVRRLFSQSFTIPAARFSPLDAVFHIYSIQRGGTGETYVDPVILRAVEIRYGATD